MRWVQETAECIASEANPATFVLDNPQNVRVQSAQVVSALLKVFKLIFQLMAACFLSVSTQ